MSSPLPEMRLDVNSLLKNKKSSALLTLVVIIQETRKLIKLVLVCRTL